MSAPPLLNFPDIDAGQRRPIDVAAFAAADGPTHPPRIVVLYGSVRDHSYARLVEEEAGRLLRWFGCEVKSFDPRDLPLTIPTSPPSPKLSPRMTRSGG